MIKQTRIFFSISKIPHGSVQHLINTRKASNEILKTYFSTTEQKVLKKYISRQEKIHLKILNEYYNPEKWSISGITKFFERKTQNKLFVFDRILNQYWNNVPKLVCNQYNATCVSWPKPFKDSSNGFFICVNPDPILVYSSKKKTNVDKNSTIETTEIIKTSYKIDRQSIKEFLLVKEFNQIYLSEHCHRCVAISEGKSIDELVLEKDKRYIDWGNRTEIIRKAKKRRSFSVDESTRSRKSVKVAASFRNRSRNRSLVDIRKPPVYSRFL